MEAEKRMAGNYAIFQAVSVGPLEVVMGEDRTAAQGEKFMCGFCEMCDIFPNYTKVMVSDDYLEILQFYGQRIKEEAERLHDAMTLAPALEIDDTPVADTGFTPVTGEDDLHDKVVVIRPDILKREYQRATHQYMLAKGGFGASPNSRGTKLYCVDLFSGKEQCFRRSDVLGIVSDEQLPHWAKDGLKLAEKKSREKEAR